jgi:cysteine synthase B
VSEARKRIARAFGAQIIFSDPLEQSDGAIRLARQLAREDPAKWFYADQYSNEANPRAHELGTAGEIWRQTGGRVTHVVLGIGTGGTVMGTGRGLRAKNPRIYKEEELTRKLSVETDAGWDMADRLIRDEGLLAGHSAGAAAEGAVRVARELREGVVVTLFPDRADRYLPPAPEGRR